MPSREAHVSTDRAERYLQQLCSHLGQMQHMRHRPAGGHGGAGMPQVEHVELTENHAVIRFAEGTWTLDADAGALRLRVEADDPAALVQLKNTVTMRIEKIGRRDGLSVVWQEADSHEPGDAGEAAHGEQGSARPTPRLWARWSRR